MNDITDSLLMLEAANILTEQGYNCALSNTRPTPEIEKNTGNTILHVNHPKLAEEAVFRFRYDKKE